MKQVKYFCDECGKEFDKSNIPPWEPDLCPEHYKEYKERQNNFSSYTGKHDPDLKVWLTG